MSGIRIKSNNFNGQSVQITFNPFTGGTINLGTQTIPYDYLTSNYEGNYSIFVPSVSKTCDLVVGVPPSPTPSITPSVTPTMTPTPSPSIPSVDPDAAAYLSDVITSGGTVDATISAATDTLFTDLKSNGLYTKMVAMYPFVGGTASSHAINALLNKTYDISWSGGVTHGISGSTGNGTNAYGDTSITLSNFLDRDDFAFGNYFTAGDTNNGIEGAAQSNGFQRFHMSSNSGGNWVWGQAQQGGTGAGSLSVANGGVTSGFQVSNKTLTTEFQGWHNGSSQGTLVASTGSIHANSYHIFAIDVAGSVMFYTTSSVGFTFFADGLLQSEVSTLSTIINTFQTSLGRNTY